ncbi:MAG TPA: branched-chain amino acid ABC transporter ATP-binding protein/permease [Beijerinckiaceae bacterium]|jgi:ABC-type branched-subunit amino acid transport system ATPase component/ABC-type branched-subunit amino acid transport system permease subunit
MRLPPYAADLGLVAAGLAYAATADSYGVFLLATVALTALAAIGLNVLMGLAGQTSFGHVGFMAIGAYATAILMERAGWPFFAAMPAAGIIAAAVGAILAMPALRVRGPYLAMVTIAFGFIIEHGAVEWRGLTGGGNGLILSHGPTLFGEKLGERGLAVVGVLLVGLALLAYRSVAASGWGYAMRAARDAEVAAGSIGIDLVRVRTAAFVLSAVAAALAGALFAPLNGYVSPSSFPFVQSILLVLAVLVGGSGTALGPVAGALVVVLLPELISALAEYRLLAFGVLMFAVLRLAPLGIVGVVERWTTRPGRSSERPPSRAPASVDPGQEFGRGRAGGGLTVEGLAIGFGGVRAVEGLSFTAEAGRITSLIGPNGAGKTTALNLLSGFYRPEAGRIALDGTELMGLSSHRLARLGVARTFQTTQLFGQLSPLENVMLGARAGRLGSPFSGLGTGRRDKGLEELSRALLAFVGAGHADGPSAALPHGEKRLVEIARALALKPRVLLLDEPAAGLALADKERLAGIFRAVAGLGVAVILVEHDMSLVMGISDHVVVLDAGLPIAAGSPEAVRADPAVREAYLGAGGPASRARLPEAPQRPRWPAADPPVLEAAGLRAGYGGVAVLRGIDLSVREGRSLAILGPNGAGKTTLMRALAGLAPPAATGDVRLAGRSVTGSPAHRRVRMGLVLIPEGRQVFPELSVRDNLRLGAFARPGKDLDDRIAAMLHRFPRLRERLDRRAGLLSGGEQQMLAIARGLLAAPKVLMLDEPSLGLAPLVVEELYASLAALRDEGLTLAVVDQMAGQALAVADEGCLIEGGVVKRSGPADALIGDRVVEEAYLGSTGGLEADRAEAMA